MIDKSATLALAAIVAIIAIVILADEQQSRSTNNTPMKLAAQAYKSLPSVIVCECLSIQDEYLGSAICPSHPGCTPKCCKENDIEDAFFARKTF